MYRLPRTSTSSGGNGIALVLLKRMSRKKISPRQLSLARSWMRWDTRRSSWRNRGCPWHRCSFRARCPRCADGNGLSCLRRVWSMLVAPGSDPERKGEPNFAYTWVHRTPGTRHPQSTSGGDEPARRRRSPVPLQRALMRNLPMPAQQARRSEFLSLMGRPKCWTCPISRRSNASAIARQWSIRKTWQRSDGQHPPGYG